MMHTCEILALAVVLSAARIAGRSGAPIDSAIARGTHVSALEATAALLERRVRAIEMNAAITVDGRALAHRVTAPFTVVDAANKPILTVLTSRGKRGLIVQHPNANGAVLFRSLAAGAAVTSVSEDEHRQAVLGISDKIPFLALRNERLTVRGTFSVSTDGKPVLEIENERGTPIASLTEGSAGAGVIQLDDRNGEPRVEAGTLNGVGEVRAGPITECIVSEGLRVPACLRGHP